MYGHHLQNRLSECLTRGSGIPNRDDALTIGPEDEREPPKVLVLGKQDSAFPCGERDDLSVHRLGGFLRESTNVVTGGSEASDDSEIEIFVGQEAHGNSHPAFGRTINSCATESAAYRKTA